MPGDKNQNGLRERVNFGLLQVVRAESLTPVKCKSRGICLPLTAIFFDRELIYSNHLLAFSYTVQLYAHARCMDFKCAVTRD